QRHVKFSFLIHFSEKITPILSGLLKITALLFWISFLVFLDIYSIKLVMTQFNTGQLSPANHIPMYLIYIGMPLGAFLMTFRVVQQIVFDLSEIKSSMTEEQSLGRGSFLAIFILRGSFIIVMALSVPIAVALGVSSVVKLIFTE